MKEQIQNIKNYLDQLQNKIKGTKYSLNEQSVIIRNQQGIRLDAVLLANANPLAVFEFKDTLSAINKQEAINSYAKIEIDCPFFIITDGLHSKIYETAQRTLNTAQNVDELWEIITAQPLSKEIEELKIKIQQEFQKEVSKFKKELKATEKSLNTADLKFKFQNINTAVTLLENGFFANLKYDPDGRFFYITEDLRDFKELENIFFKTIIEEVPKGAEIYRYGTLDNVLRTIAEKTLRLSGIVGMNDISEIGYVDGYLDKQFKPMATDDHVNSVNKKYIMCSSTLDDELMQWRLYGDDCKGACLVFQVNKGQKYLHYCCEK